MNAKYLKIGDYIKINDTLPKHTALPQETKEVWKQLAARKTPVRIQRIDEYGIPWYECRFKKENNTWETHHLSVLDEDANWTLVKKMKSNAKTQISLY